jgi:hypothetical protein
MAGSKENQFAGLFGALPKFSEFKIGERIEYHPLNATWTGLIVWVMAPQSIVGKQNALSYIVEPDERDGFPDIVPQSAIISLLE